MEAHGVGKLIPPHDVLAVEFAARLEAKVHAAVTERILREARAEHQIAAALAAIARPDAADLQTGIEDLFADEPEPEWLDHIELKANELSGTEPDSARTFNIEKKVWYDHGQGRGGSTLELVAYSKDQPQQELKGATFFETWGEARDKFRERVRPASAHTIGQF